MASFTSLTDNFNDNSLAAAWTRDYLGTYWNSRAAAYDADVTVSETNQRVEIMPRETSGTHMNGLCTAGDYDLTNDAVYVHVLQTDTQSYAECALQIGDPSTGYFQIDKDSGDIYFQYGNASTSNVVAQISYSATNHRWWRIRHGTYGGGSGTTVYFDTAPDDSGKPGTWTNRASVSNPYTITALKANFWAGSWGGLTDAVATYIDDWNGGGGGEPPAATPARRFSLALLGVGR